MIFSAVLDRARHRLFEEDVLAGLQRRDRRVGVLVPHGDDRDRVDVGIGEQLPVVGDRSSSRRTSRPASARRLSVRVQSAASSRLGMPMIASQWISPNQPSPMTPIRSLSTPSLPSKILERQLARHDDVAGRSARNRPGSDHAGDRRRGVGGEEGRRRVATSIGSTMRPSGYQRVSCVRTSGLRVDALAPRSASAPCRGRRC